MFGRRAKSAGAEVEGSQPDSGEADIPDRGPYDAADLDSVELAIDQRLDLGSVDVPIPEGAQLQIEMAEDGTPQAVHLMTEHGRISVAAYAAPKSPGQWREVTADLTESLRNDEATVNVEQGPWGREVVASTAAADLRFVGVDGYRWMIRLVAAGAAGAVANGAPLVAVAHEVLRDTVVRRGDDPHPVRTPLPVVLPDVLAQQLVAAQQQQLEAAQQQQLAAQQAEQQQSAPAAAPPKQPRRGAGGSAMQQLGR